MEADESFLSLSSSDPTAILGHVIALLKPYIVERVNLVTLVPRMECMRSVYSTMLESKADKTKASDIFFNHLRELDAPGKYQQFLAALEAANYPLIVEVIKDGTLCTVDDENRNLVELFFTRMANTISPHEMSERLQEKEIISEDEGAKIRNIARQDSRMEAALYLLSRVSCRKPTWYREFLDILWDMDHRNLVKEIDEKVYIDLLRTEGGEDLEASFSPTSNANTAPVFDLPAAPYPSSEVQRPISDTSAAPNLDLPALRVSPRSVQQDQQTVTSLTRLEASQVLPPGTNPSVDTGVLMQTMQAQIMGMSTQLSQQMNALGLVNSRLESLERKMDQILQKL